jgi:hypothetical protein
MGMLGGIIWGFGMLAQISKPPNNSPKNRQVLEPEQFHGYEVNLNVQSSFKLHFQ